MRSMRGSHQSSGLSEMSSQFHDECSDAAAALVHREHAGLGVVAQELRLRPGTFATGCMPMVLVTTPPQPASKALRMLLSDSVGGADGEQERILEADARERHRKVGRPCDFPVRRDEGSVRVGPAVAEELPGRLRTSPIMSRSRSATTTSSLSRGASAMMLAARDRRSSSGRRTRRCSTAPRCRRG